MLQNVSGTKLRTRKYRSTTKPRVKLDTRINGIGLHLIKFDRMLSSMDHMRPFHIRETGTYCVTRVVEALVCLLCNLTDLSAYVLALAIAIGPDEKLMGVSSLPLDVLGDGLVTVVYVRFNPRLK
ncbi:hypothetical protein KC325_g132 [Hortaea werneckii]|nr:hypothetical protein KC325_g132 [Hortaea werneckii]